MAWRIDPSSVLDGPVNVYFSYNLKIDLTHFHDHVK